MGVCADDALHHNLSSLLDTCIKHAKGLFPKSVLTCKDYASMHIACHARHTCKMHANRVEHAISMPICKFHASLHKSCQAFC